MRSIIEPEHGSAQKNSHNRGKKGWMANFNRGSYHILSLTYGRAELINSSRVAGIIDPRTGVAFGITFIAAMQLGKVDLPK